MLNKYTAYKYDMHLFPVGSPGLWQTVVMVLGPIRTDPILKPLVHICTVVVVVVVVEYECK